MNDLFRPPAAGFDHPLEMLEACHERVRRHATLAVRIAERIAAEGVDYEVQDAAKQVLRYFDVAGRDHHRDEEEDLFPAMLEGAGHDRRAGVTALIERLRGEHVVLDEIWSGVRSQLQAIVEGTGTQLSAASATALVDAYHDHIVEEEQLLLPLARRILSAEAIEKLGRSMAARRGATFTPAP